MALQTSGAISLANIQTEFGGSNPISLSEYYGMGGVTSSGQISIGNFYGTSNGLASYAYTNARDNLFAGNTYSDTKTFPTPVISGSTNINVSGTMYRHYNTTESSYYDTTVATTNDTQIRFKVALYNGSTLLHTTAYSSWFKVNYLNSPDSITYNVNLGTTTVGSNITRAKIYRQIKNDNNNNQLCHGVCPSDTITIG